MVVTSLSYFAFCFIALIVVTALQKDNENKKLFLMLSSYYFYSTIDWRFSILLVTLTVINFVAGKVIDTAQSTTIRKFSLAVAISLSLSILFYFKYVNFFFASIYDFLNMFGMSGQSPVVEIILPIGVSFIVFQAITYPLDLYSKKIDRQSSILDFSLFMSFFPQLLSGPIVRASFFMPQLRQNEKLTGSDMVSGICLIVRGLIKKVIIADTLAVQIVDPAFGAPAEYSSIFLIIALFAYSFQVYMDLGGYTDIAIGVGKMMGYQLPVNFNRPYLATSISNYWQRWHITMSSFFRDYLYEGIRKCSWSNIYLNLLVVFICIGIWHGAGWNFVLYGFIHGSFVGWEHYRNQHRKEKNIPQIVYRGGLLVLRIIQIFTIVTFTRLLFRGDDLSASWDYFVAIFNPSTNDLPISPVAIFLLTFAAILHFTPVGWRDKIMALSARAPAFILAGVIVVLIYISIAFDTGNADFIYFQF